MINKYRKVLSFLILGILIYSTFAIYEYNNIDVLFFSQRDYIVINPAGSVGFLISHFILQYFGFASFFIYLFFIFIIKYLLSLRKLRYENLQRLSVLILLQLTAPCFFTSYLFHKYQFYYDFLPGGYIGLYLYNLLLLKFNEFLATVLSFLLFVFTLYLVFYVEKEEVKVKKEKIILSFLKKVIFFKYVKSLVSLIFFFFSFLFKFITFKFFNIFKRKKQEEVKLNNKNKKDQDKILPSYIFPNLDFISHHASKIKPDSEAVIKKQIEVLAQALNDFGVKGDIIGYSQGPVVTMYEFRPAAGIRSSRIIAISDDIARVLMVEAVRIFLISGKDTIGFEISNQNRMYIGMRERLESLIYKNSMQNIPIILGVDTLGRDVVIDLVDTPHLLVAGTTGSGKSVGINCMIMSIIYKLNPNDCKFIMIDPKRLEFSMYNDIPHLLMPVVTEPQKAILALKWAVKEMEERYSKMSSCGVRNLQGYNEKMEEYNSEKMPWIIIFIDEMADLMLVAGKEFEVLVQRLAQMARAAGIHLVMATQRPSVDVITGVIKANFPTRISYRVTSKIDSRTILGEQGGERLLGKGDMLYMPSGTKTIRVHGPFMSDSDIEKVCSFLRNNYETKYINLEEELIEDLDLTSNDTLSSDDIYTKAKQIVLGDQKTSISYLQRKLRIGYNKAANLIEQMEQDGILTEADYTGKRQIIKNN